METTTKQPVDTLTVPVKAATATVANVAALAAAAVAAGGTAAVVAAAGGAALLGAAAKGGKKAAAFRAQRKASQSSGTRSGGSGRSVLPRMFRSGRSGAGATGARKSGASALARKGSTPTGAGARKASGVRSSGLTGAKAGMFSRRATGAGTGATRKSTGAGTLRSRASRVANSPARRWAGAKLASARKGASTQAQKARKSTAKRSRNLWRGLRKWFQRKIMGRKPEPKNRPAPLTPLRTGTDLKAAFAQGLINAPVAGTTKLARVLPPVPAVFTAPTTAPRTGGIMRDIARQMVTYAEEYDAPGILEIIDELDNNLEGSLQYVADAIRILSEKSRAKWPFDDAIVQKLGMISECLDTAAQMARGVVPDIETIHENELRRLRQPGVGQEKFDLSANGMV